jgi:carbon-monoxide dehydrogenase medium subunit
MKPSAFEYQKPSTEDAVIALLAQHGADAKILAGGQSLVPMMNFRIVAPKVLIDINGIGSLAYVREDGDTIAIGALTRHRDVAASDVIARRAPLIKAAYAHVAHVTVRNRGTIGGNHSTADPASEMPAVMVCLEATMVARGGGGERKIAAADFFTGPLETALEPTEYLAEIRVPAAPAGEGWSCQEVSPRKGDYATAGIVATLRLSGGSIAAARIAQFGVDDHAHRLAAAEAHVTGKAPGEALFAEAGREAREEVDPAILNYHGDADYKLDLVGALTRRALTEAAGRAS